MGSQNSCRMIQCIVKWVLRSVSVMIFFYSSFCYRKPPSVMLATLTSFRHRSRVLLDGLQCVSSVFLLISSVTMSDVSSSGAPIHGLVLALLRKTLATSFDTSRFFHSLARHSSSTTYSGFDNNVHNTLSFNGTINFISMLSVIFLLMDVSCDRNLLCLLLSFSSQKKIPMFLRVHAWKHV